MIKIQFEGVVKRIYSETRGQYTSNYVVASDNGGKYENVLRFKVKPECSPSFSKGARVKIAAYLDGREWANPQGQLMYFTDLKVDTIEVLSASHDGQTAFGQSSAGKPTTATDWASLCALATAYGDSQDAIKSRCEAHKAKVNRRFTPEDWQTVANEIVAAHAPQPAASAASEFDDDIPF
jgi:single-stranded DNA-binding protein